MGSPIKVALVNDYEIIVEGLREMLKPFTDRVRVVETVAGDTPDEACDIALFDTFAGRRHALTRVRAMLTDQDIAKVVLYTWDAPAAFLDDVSAMRIDGVILKSETGLRLVQSIERVHRGERIGPDPGDDRAAATVLTEREREVLALIARGASNREIAAELYLSVDTIKTHVRHLFGKLGVANRTLAALQADQFGVAAPMVQR
ncbi:MAG TPA: response regulator transcription factor [Ilumatobacteraceae bacterium]|nr:response regulator transcription factor [Ilumatobacteraceae bacterium]